MFVAFQLIGRDWRSLAVQALDRMPGSLAKRLRSDSRAGNLLRPLVNRMMPDRLATVTVRSGAARGLKMQVYPASEKFYWTGAHEGDVLERFKALISPGMTVWDIGGHVGFTAMMAAREVGPGGIVHVFEPNPDNRVRLEANLRLNRLENVVVHQIAVAGEEGDRVLHQHPSSLMWTLVPARGEQGGLSVKCETLDTLQKSLGGPDIIKIDVEGAEVDVLRGGLRLLEESSPRLIVEFSDVDMYEQGTRAVPGYDFDRIDNRHWSMSKKSAVETAA